MTQSIAWSPERVTALYEHAEATLRQTADLAERDAERAAIAAHRAADQARRNALRLRARARAAREAEGQRGERFAVIATDPAGTVRVWNREAERLYGRPAREALGRPITELTVGPEDGAVAERIMAGVRRTGSWEGEFFVRRRDGTRFLAFVRNVLVRDREGRTVGIVGVSAEVSPAASPVRPHLMRTGG